MSGCGKTSALEMEAMLSVTGDKTTTVECMIMDEAEKPPFNLQDICSIIEILMRLQKCLGARAAFLRQLANIHEVHYSVKEEKTI
ncbi:hypothetical protein NPIL_27321 [Nephila pilipes]|nr:hypothetical protein NPIL_122101 [Nephila pilipes]GFU31968.1 hypothetical protein NPIL_27321 [Nephila pilipes]